MKLFSVLLMGLIAAPALASDINLDTSDAPVCLQRVYTVDELAANPNQKLSQLTVKLQTKQYKDEDGEPYTWSSALVIGRSTADHKLYGNTAGCELQPDGSAFCQIECDGGSFTLAQRPSWINFVVTADYYFPLFKGVLEPDIENTPPQINLDGNDLNNSTWKMYQVDMDQCNQAIKNVKQVDGGC